MAGISNAARAGGAAVQQDNGAAVQQAKGVGPGIRRGTLALMVVFHVAYAGAAPVFWFFWSLRSRFRLPAWGEDAAGFLSGPLPAIAFAAAWLAAAVLFSRNRRQSGAMAFNAISALGLFTAACGMLVLASAGLDA